MIGLKSYNNLMEQINKNIKILLFEDDPEDAVLFKQQLRDFEDITDPVVAETLASGFSLIEKDDFDIIVLDLNLPDSQGADTFYKVYDKIRHIPIIVFTAGVSVKTALELVRKGAQDFLTKGVFDGAILYKSIIMSIERFYMIKHQLEINKALIESKKNVLAEREKLFRVLEDLPAFICLKSPDYRITYTNKLFNQTFGDPQGKSCYEIFYTKKEPCENCPSCNVLKTKQPVCRNWEYAPEGKSYIIYDYPFTDIDGSEFVLEMGIDVTEAKIHEKILRQSEARFKAVFEQAAVGMAMLSPEGRWLLVNQKLCDIVGYDEKELLTKTFQDITHPEDLDKDMDFVKQVLEGRIKTYSMEKRYFKKDGSIVWIDLTVALMRDEGGIPDFFISVIQDISERVKIKQELEETLSRERDAVEGADVGLWNWDVKTNTVQYSPKLKQQVGYKQDEWTDSFNEFESRVHPDDLPRVYKQIGIAQRSEDGFYKAEFRFRHKNGSYIWVLASGSVIKDENGNVIKMRGSHVNITKRKEIEKKEKEILAVQTAAEIERQKAKELLEAYTKLRLTQEQLVQAEKLSSLGQMSAGVAHELNSPLTGLITMLGFYKKKFSDDPEDQSGFQEMIDSAQHMSKIVKDLCVFARKNKQQLTEINLNEVIESTLSFGALHLKAPIAISRQYCDDLLPVMGNKTQLQQVVLNMVTNARDSMPEGGKFLIRTRNSEDGGFVIAEFEDSGQGIEKEFLGRIFDPFFSTKEPGKGTGLGLSIVHGIIEEHNGKIEVKSEKGKGTKFIILFPAIKKGDKS
jgi:PAS domain S-box-containing protein